LFPLPLVTWFMMENLLDSKNKESLKFLLTYPLFDQDTYESRIKELLSLDINGVFSFGKVQLKKICILGKGSVGLVTLARFKGQYFALKIRRTDANRANMFDEVVYQSLANSIGIGPFLVNFSENFILMEFVNGSNIVEWYSSVRTTDERILKCTALILEQCYLLDCLKLDHGQLNRLDRHIIISKDDRPTILDFETSSAMRRVSNITSVSQSIFLHGPIYSRLQDSINKDRTQIMKNIKDYKIQMNYEKFKKILNLLRH
jgi:putative serine/threonine protein kinase